MESPNTDHYTMGKGKLFFDLKDPDTGTYKGERDLGNCPELTFTIDISKLDHYSSRGGIRAKDKSIISEITLMMSFSLDEISTENMSLLTLGEITAVSQSAADAVNDSFTDVWQTRFYTLSKRNVSIVKLLYDGGTAAFNVGATLTGAISSATATIVQVDGTVASGTLYLGVVSGGPFQDDEGLSDDGGTPGAATANGVNSTLEDIVVTDGSTTFYVKDTDYTIDTTRGRIKIIDGGSISDEDDIETYYNCGTASYDKINVLANDQLEGRVRFISDVPAGENRELEVWRASITPSGDTALIGEDWSVMTYECEILKDETNHPTEPYMLIYMNEA